MIQQKIANKIHEFRRKTGISPSRIYLGRVEMMELLIWARDNGYCTYTYTEGENRPEVMGIPCYEVNDDLHLGCS